MTDRARLIRLIHVARRDLQMDEDVYRSVIAACSAGKTSSSDCDARQLNAILDHMKRVGFKVRKSAKPKTSARKMDMAAESRKVRALWLLLHQLGAVRDPSEQALATYVRRQAGVDDLRWAGVKMYPLIEGLKAWAQRVFPDQLQSRLVALQAAGIIQSRISLDGLIRFASPHRNPQTFDALWAALEYMANEERSHAEK